MSQWHAYYFDGFDRDLPPARVVAIQADNEDEAGRLAIAQMGRSLRVDVTRPLWGAPNQAVSRGQTPSEGLAMESA